MPRVASEASAVQSHQHHPRRPAAAEANTPAGPFAALLDDNPSPPDRPQRTRRQQADQVAGSDTRPVDRTRRNNDGGDKSASPTDRQQPDAPANASTDEPTAAATSETKAATKVDDTKAGDKVESGDTTAEVDPTAIALDTASSDGTVAQQAASDAPTPAPVAAVIPAVVLPTVEAASAVTEPAAAGDTAIAAAAATNAPGATTTNAPAQGAGKTDDVTSASTGGGAAEPVAPKGPEPKALGSGDVTPNNTNKSTNESSATSKSTSTDTPSGKPATGKHQAGATNAVPAAAGHGDADSDTEAASPAQSPAGAPAGANGTGKSVHATAHGNRTAAPDTAEKTGDQATRLETATAGATGAADKPIVVPQTTALPHPAERTATATAAPTGAAAADPAAVAVPVAGLAVEIASQAQAGRNRFEIRLDPPELGRIDVQLDVRHDGQVTSRLVVDKAETLDLLRRDAPQLERALAQAGLKTGDNGMQFSLRDQGFAGQNQQSDDGTRAGAARLLVADSEIAPADAVASGYGRSLRLGGGVDIRV